MSSEVKLCPQCGSAGVDFSTLSGGNGQCRGCKWVGPARELLVVPFTHSFMNDESAMMHFTQDLRQILARDMGVVLLRYLVKWGFIRTTEVEGQPLQIDRKQFTRYLVAIAKGIVGAILEERGRQEAPPMEVLTDGRAS
jgi:hypothetical protein